MSIDVYILFQLSLQFWLTNYFRKLIFWVMKSYLDLWSKKKKLSINRKYASVSHVFPKMVAQSIESTSSPRRETHIWASRVFKFNLLHKWLVIAFCLENPLSQIAILDEMSIIFGQSCIILSQFVCHSKLLLQMHQASNSVLFSHSCQSVFVNSRSCPLHMSLSFSVY